VISGIHGLKSNWPWAIRSDIFLESSVNAKKLFANMYTLYPMAVGLWSLLGFILYTIHCLPIGREISLAAQQKKLSFPKQLKTFKTFVVEKECMVFFCWCSAISREPQDLAHRTKENM
jgi:hypothetical protein